MLLEERFVEVRRRAYCTDPGCLHRIANDSWTVAFFPLVESDY